MANNINIILFKYRYLYLLFINIFFIFNDYKILSNNKYISSTLITNTTLVNNVNLSSQKDCKFCNLFSNLFNSINNFILTFRNYLFDIFNNTQNIYFKILIAFFIGLLLSLTPCIYPMIPITVGILQSNSSNSSFRSFISALFYTIGISTTFAIFGLLAVLGGSIFGEFQSSPIFVIPLVLFLLYLGFSNLGLYELYIPKFLRPKSNNVNSNSLLSIFLFGAISGTVASPCMSPGLALILDWVSTLSKTSVTAPYLQGFLLLFIFGIGSSFPLLVIGTFSGAANILPNAGNWMVEVKNIIGIMLIAISFYHLSHIPNYFSTFLLNILLILFLIFLSLFYIKRIDQFDSLYLKFYKYTISLLSLVLALYISYFNISFYKHEQIENNNIYVHFANNYQDALKKAEIENKKIIIDISSTFCTACKSLYKKLFLDEILSPFLNDNFIILKVESDINIDDFNKLKDIFNEYIKKTGFPTILIIDKDQNVIKHWGIDLLDKDKSEIIDDLKNISI